MVKENIQKAIEVLQKSNYGKALKAASEKDDEKCTFYINKVNSVEYNSLLNSLIEHLKNLDDFDDFSNSFNDAYFVVFYSSDLYRDLYKKIKQTDD